MELLFMRKKILAVVLTSIITSSMPVYAANKNQQVEEPLRLRDDRETLIQNLTNEKVSQEINPLSPSEIIQLKKDTMEVERAMSSQVHDPKPLFRTIEIKTNNVTNLRDIYLAPNYGTTLIFLDKMGNYWPIESYVLPLPKSTIDRDVINTGTLVLTPKKYEAKGNLIIMLKGSKIPLMLTLNVNTDKVDYKTELRIDDYGPNSQLIQYNGSNTKTEAYTDLSSQAKFAKKEKFQMLEGITPDGYTQRETTHNSVEAWSKGKALFIKTKASLISPNLLEEDAYNSVKAADGSYLYTVPFMPEILLSMGGNIIQVGIK